MASNLNTPNADQDVEGKVLENFNALNDAAIRQIKDELRSDINGILSTHDIKFDDFQQLPRGIFKRSSTDVFDNPTLELTDTGYLTAISLKKGVQYLIEHTNNDVRSAIIKVLQQSTQKVLVNTSRVIPNRSTPHNPDPPNTGEAHYGSAEGTSSKWSRAGDFILANGAKITSKFGAVLTWGLNSLDIFSDTFWMKKGSSQK